MSVPEPQAEVAFVRQRQDSTVTVRLEHLEGADHVRVHAESAACADGGTLPVILTEPGEDTEIADLQDDELITVTAVGDGVEQLVARYQE
jgi:hypothetical protein